MEYLKYIRGTKHLKKRSIDERKTIKIAIKEELKENRKVRVANSRKPYDILSINNNYKNV